MPAPRRRLRALTAVAALALLGAACGDDDEAGDPTLQVDGGEGGGAGAASADVPDPCGLVTLADVEGWFGDGFEEGTLTDDTDNAGQKQCTWGGTEGMTAKVVSITVATEDSQLAVFPVGGAELFEQTRDAVGEAITEADLGLGDQSYGTESSLHVLDGDTTYTFSISGSSDEARAGLRSMAGHVVGG